MDRHRQPVDRFCLILGADTDLADLVASLIDAHPAALVARGPSVVKNGSLKLDGLVRFLDRVTPPSAGKFQGHRLVGMIEGRSTMRTLRRRPERLRELADALSIPVAIVNVLRDPFEEVEAARDGGDEPRVRVYRDRLETLRRIEEHAPPGILHLRVEELQRDPPAALARACRFLRLELNADHLEGAWAAVSEQPGRTPGEALTAKETKRVELMIHRFDWLKAYRKDRAAQAPSQPRVGPGSIEHRAAPGRVTPSGLTEYLFDPAVPDDQPVLLFQHIQKTAGSSLRALIRANLPNAERRVSRHDHFLPPRVLLDSFRRDRRGLSPERWSQLRCVMSHRANFALPDIERPVEAITVVREPVERVVSHHYFGRARDPENSRRTLGDVYAELDTSFGGPDEVAVKHCNLQSRTLLAPDHDPAGLGYTRGPGPDAELWRERLFTIVCERYTVGLQERIADFVRLLASRFQWQETELAEIKVSPRDGPQRRPDASELPERLLADIRAYNWLDLELYELCVARFDQSLAARARD